MTGTIDPGSCESPGNCNVTPTQLHWSDDHSGWVGPYPLDANYDLLFECLIDDSISVVLLDGNTAVEVLSVVSVDCENREVVTLWPSTVVNDCLCLYGSGRMTFTGAA